MHIELVNTYLPDNRITNLQLEQSLDTSDEWITKRTGIKARHWEQDSIKVMAEKLLADYDGSKLDAIIVTSMSNPDIAPSLAAYCASLVGANNAMCFDLNSACTGFVYGLNVAEGLLQLDKYQNVLIVSIEKMSDIIDKHDRSVAILFGDGAAAYLCTKAANGIIAIDNATDFNYQHLVNNERGQLEMNGQEVFKFATKAIENHLTNLDVDLAVIDHFVFHQANKRIIDNVVRRMKLDKSKVVLNIAEVANTSSASIAIALSTIQLKPNETVVMVGFGAGLSSGAIVYKH